MLALAFETSADLGSAALGSGEVVIAQSVLSARSAHSEALLPAIRDLLLGADTSLNYVEAIVVGAGPGSFTGLRIGAAMAKGLCFGGQRPLYAYSSLSAVVAGREIEGRVCVMLDARGDRVFAATFGSTRPLRELGSPKLAEVNDLIDELRPLSKWSFGGDGSLKHEELIREAGGRLLPEKVARPRAEGLLSLFSERPEGRVEDVASWEPEYLLPSSAERAASRPTPAVTSARETR